MNLRRGHDLSRGFALILVLSLLALLVLLTYAVSSVSKVDGEISTASVYQARARQNAMAGLESALNLLQQYAGDDNRVTGMAGVVGVPEGSNLRQLTGVWGNPVEPIWLVSGATNGGLPIITGDKVLLVGDNSVGSPADRTDQELVEAGLLSIPDTSTTDGHMAYWVGDEGVKVSAVVPDADAQTATSTGLKLRMDARRLLGPKFDPLAANLEQVLTFEQLQYAGGSTLTLSLTGAFHNVTRTHWARPTTAPSGSTTSSGYIRGAFNINTTSAPVWRGLLEYPDRSNTAYGLSSTSALNNSKKITAAIAARAVPFVTIADLLASGIIQDAFASTPNKVTTMTAQEFVDDLAPILAVRSDTFRIRAYGDAINPADASDSNATPESVAYCEAIVQRTDGEKFVITYFRWLGPDDI